MQIISQSTQHGRRGIEIGDIRRRFHNERPSRALDEFCSQPDIFMLMTSLFYLETMWLHYDGAPTPFDRGQWGVCALLGHRPRPLRCDNNLRLGLKVNPSAPMPAVCRARLPGHLVGYFIVNSNNSPANGSTDRAVSLQRSFRTIDHCAR